MDTVELLIYLYHNYMDAESPPPPTQEQLKQELVQAGFGEADIDRTLGWLDELALQVSRGDDAHLAAGHASRIFSAEECLRLDTAARGLLLRLEQDRILDPACRELVLDQALAMDIGRIGMEELKWIALLVLMNRPGQEEEFNQMEGLVFNTEPARLH